MLDMYYIYIYKLLTNIGFLFPIFKYITLLDCNLNKYVYVFVKNQNKFLKVKPLVLQLS